MNPAETPSPIRTFQVDALTVRIDDDAETMGRAAAQAAATHLQQVLQQQSRAAVVFACAPSQVAFLRALTAWPDLDWSRVIVFHMDEYLGLAADHPASFRRFLREHLIERVQPGIVHYIEGDALEPLDECDRYTALLQAQPIDLCCLGIGENGHLAFNDPPVARFDDPRTIKLVRLDTVCRQQQVGEGHFPSIEAVPQYALTLTVPALCQARRLVCIVPDRRKAAAVRQALQGPIETQCPASFLRRQPQAALFLDQAAASGLTAP